MCKAGDGNRTHAESLGSSRSTIELHPQRIKIEAFLVRHPLRLMLFRYFRIYLAKSLFIVVEFIGRST